MHAPAVRIDVARRGLHRRHYAAILFPPIGCQEGSLDSLLVPGWSGRDEALESTRRLRYLSARSRVA